MTRADDLRDWDAAYVLGALTPEDRRAYETYLAENPARASEVSEIAGIPGLLSRLPIARAVALTEERPVETGEAVQAVDVTTLISSLSRRRRRVRAGFAGSILAVAACALLLGIGLANSNISTPSIADSSSTSPAPMPMLASQSSTLEADLATTVKPWGTRLDVRCTYSAQWTTRSKTFELVVTSVQGTRTVVASWSSSGYGAKDIAAATHIPIDAIRRIDITDADTHTTVATTWL